LVLTVATRFLPFSHLLQWFLQWLSSSHAYFPCPLCTPGDCFYTSHCYPNPGAPAIFNFDSSCSFLDPCGQEHVTPLETGLFCHFKKKDSPSC
jgi:hypothetical protein